MNKQIILIISSLVIIASIIGLIVAWHPKDGAELPMATSTPELPVAEVDSDKIIYDSTGDEKPEDFKANCEAQGGRFNECGSPCGPEAEACILMCVYTCELGPEKPDNPTSPREHVTIGLGQRVTVLGLTITPQAVLEDSRCPSDVQCIQAGTVRLRTHLAMRAGVETRELKLSESIAVGDMTVTLLEVLPDTISTKPITSADYRFVFEVIKN